MAGSSTSPAVGRDEVADLRGGYLDAVLAPDARAARALVEEGCEAGLAPARIYLEVLQPALHDIGRRAVVSCSPGELLVGGQAFGGDERRAGAVGAHAYADDPGALLALVADRFADAPDAR